MGTDGQGSAEAADDRRRTAGGLRADEELGTNGGGFYGMNSAHPFENPTALRRTSSTCVAMMLFPFALVLMYGRMLRPAAARVGDLFGDDGDDGRHRSCGRSTTTRCKPNPGPDRASRAPNVCDPERQRAGRQTSHSRLPAVAGLPVDQHLGNLEGKEMRFGTSAGATFAALTVDVTCGAVNCEHDSLNPIAALSPMVGMWVNCIFGGKGVGHDQHADLPDHRDLHGGPDGGAHARVSGQEDRRRAR